MDSQYVGIPPQVTQSTKGAATPTANGLTSTFSFPHGLAGVPSHISITPRNVLSAALSYATADATNITVTFLSIPLAGTLSFYWRAEL